MEKGKRILFLAEINSVHIDNWVKYLTTRGYHIYLFSLSKSKVEWPNNTSNFNYNCYGFNDATVSSSKRFSKLSYFKARKEAKAYFDLIKPDVVHAHYASSYGMLAKYIGFKNTVLSVWGSDVYVFPGKSIIHKYLFKRIVKFAKIVCSTSQDMAHEANKWVPRNYVVTPFGVDTNRFVPLDNRPMDQPLTIGTVKMLENVYGLDRLIRLYSEFTKRYKGKSRLMIFGSGSQEKMLKNLTEQLGLKDNVIFGGFVINRELEQAFQSFDIFCALSRRESFGVATLEAQSSGLPVFVTNVGGLPEVTSPLSGTIVNENESEKWIDSLMSLVDRIENEDLAHISRNFVISNFSHDVCVDKIIQVYQDVQRV